MHPNPTLLANEKGSVIVVAVIILALLTLIGISATTTSTTETQIATNEQLQKTVFYTADAGIQVGRRMLNTLKASDPASWDNLLSETVFMWQDSAGNDIFVHTLDQVVDATAERQVGLASFTLQVSDNDDLDGNALVDTDDTLILTSTATYRNARAQIQAAVLYTGPSDQYAQEHYDNRKSGTNTNESGDVENSQRW